MAWWDNRVYPLPGKLKTLLKTVIHFVVGVYGNFDTSGYALGIQIPIYTSNSVYNLPVFNQNMRITIKFSCMQNDDMIMMKRRRRKEKMEERNSRALVC